MIAAIFLVIFAVLLVLLSLPVYVFSALLRVAEKNWA